MVKMKIGSSIDYHRLVEGRDLILGGITIPYPYGLLGHSDADVLTHAILEAILGALGKGDLGKNFPDSDKKYFNISSLKLLEMGWIMMNQSGYTIGNIDASVIAQAPKLNPYFEQMKKNYADVLQCSEELINLKATTTEGLGPVGDGKMMMAQAVVLLIKGE